MSQPGILIIAVIYNTYEETLRYLESLAKTGASDITLILADNSDKANSQDFLVKIEKYPFVHYLKTGKNLGYFGGAREGLKYYLQDHSNYPPWILVTNVDIVFTPEFFTRLNKYNHHQSIGIVAPSIISQKWKRDFNPKIVTRGTKKKLQFNQLLYSNFLLQNIYFTAVYL
jgi:GT2 family glycosyltransferase